MKTQHTPGPWHADAEGIVRHTGSDTAVKLASGYIENAFVGDDGTDETRANARLIAVAPDLLAVVKELVEIERRDSLADPDQAATGAHRERTWDAARAAVAKATGEERT
jgi:hypothetical protein